MPIPAAKTEAPLFDPTSAQPGEDDSRRRRASVPGRPNLLKLGTVLQNRYRILDVLGIGGMSTVYKARDLRFTTVDRACAVKEMFNSADELKLRQMRFANFQREAALLATLTHSAIPRIYDYFEHQSTIYLVLEMIHGQDLESILSQRGEPFDEAQIVDWAISLCGVLHYLHNQKPEPIIFRDLKPSNIMIRADDQALMLVDFGIARTFAPQQRGTMIGTEGYAPPEQYKGIADARGDIYALGATLHHLATGNDPRMETPFTFASRPPRKLNPMLSEEFEKLVLRSVSYHPEERFQTISDVREALEAIRLQRLQAAGVVAVPSSPTVQPNSGARAVEAPKRDRESGSKLLATAALEPQPSPSVSLPAAPALATDEDTYSGEDRLDWILKTGDEVRSSASAAGGAVYVGSYDGNLYAIDETDGSVRWRFKTQRGIVSRPTPFAEMVIFGSEDKSVYAVARQNGRAIWSFQTNAPVRSSAIAEDRMGAIGSDDGFLYRFDRTRGVVTFRYKTWGPVRSTPGQSGDDIVFGSDDGYLYSVSAESGRLTWRFQIGAPVMSSPAIKGSIVVVGAADGVVRGFNLRDGKLLWTVSTPKTVISSPAIDDDVAYIGSADGHAYAIRITDGQLVWKTPICRQITSSPTVDGSVLYVGGNDSVFYCLNRDDGSVLWRFGAGAAIVTKPLVTNDHVIFGSLDGNVYAVHREK